MLFENVKFNPVRDVQAVEPAGFVDLAKANSMNAIPATLAADDLSYNEIDDPRSIGGRPSDVFEAAQASKAILSYVPPKNNAE